MSATNGVSRRVDSPLTCEYDGDPRRPECEHIAVVAYGPIALCASCNLRRSTVGKGISPRWLEPPAPQREALLIVESARQQLGQAEARLTAAVPAAAASDVTGVTSAGHLPPAGRQPSSASVRH